MTTVLTSWHISPPRATSKSNTTIKYRLSSLPTIYLSFTMSSAPWLDGPADRFPSSYLLACPSTEQYQRLSNCDGDIGYFFSNPSERESTWFLRSLARPAKNAKRVQRYRPNATSARELSWLEQLPNELVDAVLDALLEDEDRVSVLALGLASPVLYPLMLAYIHRSYATKGIAPWAGKKVGFLGGDSPVVPSRVTASGDEFFEYITMDTELWWRRDGWQEVCMQPEKAWRESLEMVVGREESVWQDVDEDLGREYMYPRDGGWVLRNLTTRQCVRDDGLVPPEEILEDELFHDKVSKKHLFNSGSRVYDPAKPGKELLHAQTLEAFALPRIFLVLTAHSAHPGWTEENAGFTWGPWVNHAFELVTLAEHLESLDPDWQDVTAHVAADVGHLRWCVMQHAALAKSGAANRWRRMRDSREQALQARTKWTQWAKKSVDVAETSADGE